MATRQMESLVASVCDSGGKLVLTGDAKQTQPIEAGAPFRLMDEILNQAELTEITRQKEDWAREAVHSVVRGESRSAMEEFAKRGLLTVTKDRDQAMESLAQDWSLHGPRNPKDHLVIAGVNVEVAMLNRMLQHVCQEKDILGDSSIPVIV